ncbi:S8 family serine peptidase, partial [Patescibacteria group bacterium]|nr:S8 family serine peptidase [Patescibacteria group bacterium]
RGHGTHVSGTIAAEGNNGKGIAGVAPKASIMASQGFDSGGNGTSDVLANAIMYATDNGAKVINNSWECRFPPCPNDLIEEDAVRYAYNQDIVIIFSAGNTVGEDISFKSPQNMTETISVAASNENDDPTVFTSVGYDVDVAAPGGGPDFFDQNILSLLSANASCHATITVGTNYCRMSGTSMSAPHVAGLAALIREKHPEFTNEQVRQAIRVSADDISDPGFDVKSGYGRINVAAALAIDNPLKVKITSPARQTNINGQSTVDILGTAAGTGFESYSLSYGVGLTPSEFLPFSGPITTPVTEGTLGIWDVSSLDKERYIIKLTAVASGVTYTNHVLVIKENSNPLIIQPGVQQRPQVDEGKVVWEDTRNGIFTDIYLFNFSTGKETQITNEPNSFQRDSSISGDKIVWEDLRSGNPNIFLHDIFENSTRPVIDDAITRVNPSIDGNKIVWQESGDIYVYDLDTGIKTQITSDQTIQPNDPAISGNRIVWMDGRNGNFNNDIYFYDLDNPGTGEIQVTTSTQQNVSPDIYGDKIVYEENGKIFMYDIPSSSTTRISNPSCQLFIGCGAIGASIYGNRVVWTDWRDPSTDVWLYDISLGEEEPVTTDLDYQSSPDISAAKIVWRDERFGGRDLFYSDIPVNNAPKLRVMYPDVPITAGVGSSPQPNDGTVNILDIGAVVNAFGKNEANPQWHSWFKPYDLNRDGFVNIIDIGLVIQWFGSVNWPPGNSETNRITVSSSAINVQFYLTATDPDTTSLPTITASGLPEEVTFTTEAITTPGGDTFMRGKFFWDLTTTSPSGQNFDITFTADDGVDTTELTLYFVR